MARRRVVVTGMGLVSCLGLGVEATWKKLLAGASGIVRLTDESYSGFPCRIAGVVPGNELIEQTECLLRQSDLKTMSRGIQLSILAVHEALTQAKWEPKTDDEKYYSGVAFGSGMDSVTEVIESSRAMQTRGYRGMNPYALTRSLGNMAAGHVSIRYGLRGPNRAVNTACATGMHCIGDAFRHIQLGEAKVMVAGGTEAAVHPWSVAAFCRIRALAASDEWNQDPDTASRPFDARRAGFVMSEGAGALVLEELEHARERGANILGEVLGYGMSGDAYHLTAPDPNGVGAYRCMTAALKDANIEVDEIGYINAHATSTPLGDTVESAAISRLLSSGSSELKNEVLVSSTKGHVGHLLGAAAALEVIASFLACIYGQVPPTRNLEQPDTGQDLCYVDGKGPVTWEKAQRSGRRVALCNSFGFGGTNASLCLGEIL